MKWVKTHTHKESTEYRIFFKTGYIDLYSSNRSFKNEWSFRYWFANDITCKEPIQTNVSSEFSENLVDAQKSAISKTREIINSEVERMQSILDQIKP